MILGLSVCDSPIQPFPQDPELANVVLGAYMNAIPGTTTEFDPI